MNKAHLVLKGSLVGFIFLWSMGCGEGMIETYGDPQVQVTRLSLNVDNDGALQAQECVDKNGVDKCTAYPNPLACDKLEVKVMGDASTIGECWKDKKMFKRLTKTADGIPFGCRVNKTSTDWVQCMDLYQKLIVNVVNGTVHLFEEGNDTANNDADTNTSDMNEKQVGKNQNGTISTPPTQEESDKCDVLNARKLYVEKFNALLAKEGLKFTYQPDYTKELSDKFFKTGQFFSRPGQMCEPDHHALIECDAAMGKGQCYCGDQYLGLRCRCARLSNKALADSCGGIPTECDLDKWAAMIWAEYGEASQWLTNRGGSTKTDAKKTLANATGPQDIKCQGSPLVFDLLDNGLDLSGVSDGIDFNLLGTNTNRISWVKGSDDALLAIDLNGNGIIDNGRELFGEASLLGGRIASDGFAALSMIDRPQNGGNDNGLVEAGDLMYDQLVLWKDKNHDGVSQPGELESLADNDISAISFKTTNCSGTYDSKGNDISLRANFIRRDGSQGLVVDVYFMMN